MWRALFLAIGVTLIMLGGQLFFVEQIEVVNVRGGGGENPAAGGGGLFQQASWQQPSAAQTPPTFLYTPRDWMPWSLLAIGAVVVIYTFTIPARRSGGGGD